MLFCGDIEGHIKEVVEKVKKLNGSRVGPFDVLFCVGRFLDENNQIAIDSTIAFPIPTYIILKDDVISPALQEQLSKVPNLSLISAVEYLSVNSLRVLCIPGVYDEKRYEDESNVSPIYYRKSQIDKMLEEGNGQGVDFVLSAEWALGMLHYLDSSKFPSIPNSQAIGSPIIGQVLKAVCPRYHFAGSMNTFYERIPYRNPNGHITRLLCLGPVRAGADKSRKWLHALNVTPFSQMNEEELTQCDSLSTASPFETPKRINSSSSFPAKRVQTQDSVSKVSKPESRYENSSNSTRSNCWFCLAAPNVEKHLIVSVGESAYLACPKGQLTTGHILIIPIIHRQSTIQLPEEALSEIERYKEALVKMFRDQGKAVLLWERNLTTRNPVHCHIQLLPIDAAKESVVKIVLDAAATQRGFHFADIPEAQTLKEFAGEDDYLYAEVWGVHAEKPKKIGYVVKERRPHMQFFHQAVGALLETENAGDDWKALQKSVDEETEIANVYREMFKPYDFNTKETSS